MRPFKWLGDLVDRVIDKASTCRECGCGYMTWREDCDCTRSDCECGGFKGPDTDGDDTFDYLHPAGPAEPARGKWWLRGKCSMACADVNCPPYGPCQREERYLADQMPPASLPWLNGTPSHTESERRRDFNVARYGRDESVRRGDLANALKGDDWLEDHGMSAADRATCHSCQAWADHAHNPTTGALVTVASPTWAQLTGPQLRNINSPAEPPVEVCGICDQPESAHPATEWAPGGADPQDGHHYCQLGRRCPTCQSTAVSALVVVLPPVPHVDTHDQPREH